MHHAVANVHTYLAMNSSLYEQMVKYSSKEQQVDIFKFNSRFNTPLCDSHIADVGLLPPSLAYSLVSVYSRLKTSFVPQPTPETPKIPLAAVCVMVRGLSEAYLTLRNDIHDTVMRLHAVRLGHIDPGPGQGGEFGSRVFSSTGDDLARKHMEAAE
jgi:hypothetical protein